MDAKKCDRCGKYYDYDPKVNIDVSVDGYEYDLCPRCEDDLNAFITGTPVAGIVKEED